MKKVNGKWVSSHIPQETFNELKEEDKKKVLTAEMRFLQKDSGQRNSGINGKIF